VTGSETEYGDRDRPTFRDLGVRVVDLEGGTIAAERPSGSAIDWALPAPDGRSVYVLGPNDPEQRSRGGVLRRLDALTLEPLAERRFPTWPNVLLVMPAAFPAPPGG
jgi:hypothetical protein